MNKYQKEYLGKKIEVVEAKNPSLKGFKGKIIGETKFSFKIKTKEKQTTILKKTNVFLIDEEIVEGYKITKRPEERIKIKR